MVNIIEVEMDLFDLKDTGCVFVQCISADGAMGKGIATQFNRQFNIKNTFHKLYDKDYIIKCYDEEYITFNRVFKVNNVYNLVTKRNYWNKPTYRDISLAISDLKFACMYDNVNYLAMPRIGCGLDGLKWERVRKIIEDEFDSIGDIKIVVCSKAFK